MAKKKKKADEQLDLIDFHPENAKEIVRVARAYKEYQRARLDNLKNEVARKQELIALVDAAEMKPLEGSGGVIKFHVDGVEIIVTPQDRKVQVKELDPTE